MNGSKYQYIGMAAIKNTNGSFIAPTKHMKFPFQAGALPVSISSQDWTLVNVSASGKSMHHTLSCKLALLTDPEG